MFDGSRPQLGPDGRQQDRAGCGGAPATAIAPGAVRRLVAAVYSVDGDDGHTVATEGDVRHGPTDCRGLALTIICLNEMLYRVRLSVSRSVL